MPRLTRIDDPSREQPAVDEADREDNQAEPERRCARIAELRLAPETIEDEERRDARRPERIPTAPERLPAAAHHVDEVEARHRTDRGDEEQEVRRRRQ